ncbi:response regulator [Novosphingobium terrae]|uniref:response regulator n=1 Tax=Novosphingobium terrae TaxID=2726189 RepID=UPI00197F0F48|nr:response regulator [Novosphingobium terrae]
MTIEGNVVLILEDEPIIALSLEDLIEDAGGTSICAERVEQAIAMIDEYRLDAAILDVNVHGRKSYPVAEVLQSRGIIFIFATGYGDTLHPEQFKGVPTVVKPYSALDIERALQAAALE